MLAVQDVRGRKFLTKNDFAAVQDTNDLVPRGTVGLNLEEF